jgi:tripartite-type tricarboxylate transporter receptor subunit TctC
MRHDKNTALQQRLRAHIGGSAMTINNRRHFLKLGAAALAAPALLPRLAAAEDWPAGRSIRALVPFTAGSTIDIIGRIVLDPLSRQLGQTIVVENRGGAGGTLGTAMVAKADPDGYTLLINAAAHSGAPAAYTHLPYDTANDFSAVACFGSVPNVLLIAPSKGIKTVQELVAKAKDGTMTFASAGVGSATHWAARALPRVRRLQGDACAVPRRTGGAHRSHDRPRRFRVDRRFSGLPFIHNGTTLALAVSSAKRSPALPDVPTMLEAGYKESDFNYWNGMLVPAKTPRPIVDRLYAEVTKALALPEVQSRLGVQGVEPAPLAPTEMDAMIKREIDLNIKIAEAAGLKFN